MALRMPQMTFPIIKPEKPVKPAGLEVSLLFLMKKENTSWEYYSFIRRVNLMLDHIDGSQMTEAEKAHWRSVGYFFRSYR